MTSATVGKRLVTAAVMCGLLVGVSGCESHSVLSGSGQPVDKSSVSASANAGRRDPDRIYANHDKGVPPDQTMGDVKGSEDFNRNLKIYEKWGVKQTSEWLEICNQVNVPVLRKVGVDPQKDLQNRRGGQFKFTCSWFTTHETVQFFFSTETSLQTANTRHGFKPSGQVNRYGETYDMGDIEFIAEGTPLNRYSCALNLNVMEWPTKPLSPVKNQKPMNKPAMSSLIWSPHKSSSPTEAESVVYCAH